MKEHMYSQHSPKTGGASSFFRSPAGITLLVFLVIAAFYLITEHTAHVFGLLPYALVLLCPIMHLLMHGSHGGHGGQSGYTDHNGHSDDATHQASRPEGEQ